MKSYLAIVVLIVGGAFAIPTNFVLAQRVIWEKTYSLPDESKVMHVSKINPSTYFALGNTYYRNFWWGGNNPRIISFKFNSRGDSSSFVMYPDTSSYPLFCQSIRRTNNFWIVGKASGRRQGIIFRKIDSNGNTLLYRFIQADSTQPGYFDFPTQIIPTNDDGIILISNKAKVVDGRNASLQYVSRYDSEGNQLWYKTYMFNFKATSPNHIEPTNRGTFLVSGSDGPEIYTHEIDSAGTSIRRRILYTHPQYLGWRAAFAKQFQGGNIYFEGTEVIVSSRIKKVSGMNYQGNSNIWTVFDSTYSYWTCNPNNDGYFWTILSVAPENPTIPYGRYYAKISPYGNIVKRIKFSSDSATNSYDKIINDLLYLGDGKAILGGSISNARTNNNKAFYLCKMDSIGLPFDPTPVEEKIDNSTVIRIYPNPASSHFTIEVSNPTIVQVLNALGQVVITQKVNVTTEINTSMLPSGMYTVLAEGYKASSLVVSR